MGNPEDHLHRYTFLLFKQYAHPEGSSASWASYNSSVVSGVDLRELIDTHNLDPTPVAAVVQLAKWSPFVSDAPMVSPETLGLRSSELFPQGYTTSNSFSATFNGSVLVPEATGTIQLPCSLFSSFPPFLLSFFLPPLINCRSDQARQ